MEIKISETGEIKSLEGQEMFMIDYVDYDDVNDVFVMSMSDFLELKDLVELDNYEAKHEEFNC